LCIFLEAAVQSSLKSKKNVFWDERELKDVAYKIALASMKTFFMMLPHH